MKRLGEILIAKGLLAEDDEPVAVAEWLPALASALGAKPPQRMPRWLGRLLAGEAAAVLGQPTDEELEALAGVNLHRGAGMTHASFTRR